MRMLNHWKQKFGVILYGTYNDVRTSRPCFWFILIYFFFLLFFSNTDLYWKQVCLNLFVVVFFNFIFNCFIKYNLIFIPYVFNVSISKCLLVRRVCWQVVKMSKFRVEVQNGTSTHLVTLLTLFESFRFYITNLDFCTQNIFKHSWND